MLCGSESAPTPIFGFITLSIFVTLTLGAVSIVTTSQGFSPEISFVLLGLFAGIPAGALMALSAQAVNPENRGPGLGVFHTWYYVGLTVGPALAVCGMRIFSFPSVSVALQLMMQWTAPTTGI